jgi:predicted chitinase
MITLDQLKAIYREAPVSRLELFLPILNQEMPEAGIESPVRIQMFLAQLGHESGQLRYMEELASGAAYEMRKDLGNTSPGDGVKYKGRGLIQVTGKSNYLLCGLALNLDLLNNPGLLSQPQYAVESAIWFWTNNNLNSYCDKGDFKGLTRRINGGYNGLEDRLKLYERAKVVIK